MGIILLVFRLSCYLGVLENQYLSREENKQLFGSLAILFGLVVRRGGGKCVLVQRYYIVRELLISPVGEETDVSYECIFT